MGSLTYFHLFSNGNSNKILQLPVEVHVYVNKLLHLHL